METQEPQISSDTSQGGNELQGGTKQSPNQAVASGAKTAATAITSAAKAAAGDVAGAIADLLKDENVQRLIAAIVLGSMFLLLCGSMLMGSALTGTIQNLKEGYVAHYDQLYEDYAISANGSTFALYTYDHQAAQQQAMGMAIADAIESLFQKESAYDNSNVPDGNATVIEDETYRNTLQAVKDKEAFVGEDGALHSRLNMIKGRVEQRGLQLASQASSQYELSALGLSIGEYLDNALNNPILFAGVDLANSSLEINTKAFELSDIQALKILAAYSIQNDCNVQNIDMWDLMNYCGWYGSAKEELTTVDTTDTIYDTELTANYGMEIGGVVQEGDVLSTEIRHLDTPRVPYWSGSCAEQWYYEEIAQLRKNNELYDQYEARGNTEALEGMIRYEEDANGNILLSNFDKLSNYETFGLVDQIYTATTANLVVTRTEYHGASEWYREAIANLAGAAKSLVNKWTGLFASSSDRTAKGNVVSKSSSGNFNFTLYTSYSNRYYLYRPSTGWTSATKLGAAGGSITFTGLSSNTYYEVYEERGPLSHPDMIQRRRIDSFTTGETGSGYQAYMIQLNVDVSYAARSVDEMVTSVLGLWPGSLADTEAGSDGRLYAFGNANNDLLASTWTDTYTDSSGNKHTITFTRQQAYQAEAYQDYIIAIADALGFDTGSLFGDAGYGQTIVDIAMAEYEYYHANNLYEGGRYWDMVKQATGVKYADNTAWCVCFVMTCAWQADLLGEGKAWEGVDWIYYCTGLYNELVNSGVASGYCSAGDSYKPVPGDIVFFNESVTTHRLSHVGLVKEVTEDGKLITLEGNKSDILRMDTYGSYRIGTHAYGSCVIAAYCHPTYPATYLQNPLYETVLNSITPSANTRILSGNGNHLFLAGLGRFRWSQIPAVLDALEESYPELYKQELRNAYTLDDKKTFISEWNRISMSDKKDNFKIAQRRILNELYVQPICSAVKNKTGFDWKKTQVREEILLGIVTTTDKQQGCISLLSALCSGMDNNIPDQDLLAKLQANNYLYNLVSANRNYLWPNDAPVHRDKWCVGIQALLNKVIKVQEEAAASAEAAA